MPKRKCSKWVAVRALELILSRLWAMLSDHLFMHLACLQGLPKTLFKSIFKVKSYRTFSKKFVIRWPTRPFKKAWPLSQPHRVPYAWRCGCDRTRSSSGRQCWFANSVRVPVKYPKYSKNHWARTICSCCAVPRRHTFIWSWPWPWLCSWSWPWPRHLPEWLIRRDKNQRFVTHTLATTSPPSKISSKMNSKAKTRGF